MIWSINCWNRIIVFLPLLWLSTAAAVHASEAPQQAPFDVGQAFRVVVLPVENLAGTSAPLKEIRLSLSRGVHALGKQVVADDALEACLARHRFRYTGGVDPKMAQAFRDDVSADAVLVTSLESYVPVPVPKIAVTCRLVSTEQTPRIIWMESVGLTGNDAPGILGLGLVTDTQKLQKKALRQLVTSLASFLARHKNPPSSGWGDRVFRPKQFYAGADAAAAAERTVVVMPFFNKSKRKNANQILLLHFVRQLWGVKGITVVEPGVVRGRMLALRTIMKEGFSYRDMDLVAGEAKIDAFLSGKVYEYQDSQVGEASPVIDFSAVAVERESRKVLWASTSYNKGDDPVYFFDIGRVNSASVMAAKMVRAISLKMFGGGS